MYWREQERLIVTQRDRIVELARRAAR
jgi:hypothetical protein